MVFVDLPQLKKNLVHTTFRHILIRPPKSQGRKSDLTLRRWNFRQDLPRFEVTENHRLTFNSEFRQHMGHFLGVWGLKFEI